MHGGHADVAMRLGWKMMSKSRKPPGYWDSLPNVLREVTAFCEDQVRCAPAYAHWGIYVGLLQFLGRFSLSQPMRVLHSLHM